jgi:hypothetical protein
LLDEVQELLNTLAVIRSSDSVSEEIQTICNGFDAACDLVKTIRQQLMDVQQFAGTVVDSVQQAVSTAESFALCRQLEAVDLQQSLDKEVALKMRELQNKRAAEPELQQSQLRQVELQRKIAELESKGAATQVSWQLNRDAIASSQQVLLQQPLPNVPPPPYESLVPPAPVPVESISVLNRPPGNIYQPPPQVWADSVVPAPLAPPSVPTVPQTFPPFPQQLPQP